MTYTSATQSYDQGLRSYLSGVYNRLAGGILLTAVLAWVASQEPLRSALYGLDVHHHMTYTVLGWVVAFAPLGVILLGGMLVSALDGNAAEVVELMFWSVAALFGLSLGTLFSLYTGTSLALTFAVTSAGFGGLSLWGYTTKRDLTGLGAFLMVGLIGLIVASLINAFLHLQSVNFVTSIVGILIFSGFIAYDTQKLKNDYEVGMPGALGALNLYLDFVNLFLYLLRFLGQLKDND